ncbi:potassium channel family protein [Zavarzinia compransoris]|uniref:Ion transporter n=1 Tax=Zavarzinia compransoris TaxID=1264899 RepID=A0A317EDW6_9PROT|nr:potassium channel family protein [Zavarzinia compransoris]PWR23543.1 ion transporter [Zavarzinia compransoris]TDP47753.1 voltage-gated potassium channel [Zavarzinia compransoris]
MTDQKTATAKPRRRRPFGRTLRLRLADLYRGSDPLTVAFRYGLFVFDLATIVYFVGVSFVAESGFWQIDLAIGVLMALDVAARFVIAPRPLRHLLLPSTLFDLVVVASLLVPGLESLAFLRILRARRIAVSYQVLGELKRLSPWLEEKEMAVRAGLDLFVFIFIMSGVIFALQHRVNPGIHTFADAIYFTVTTLTTTGFGDVVLVGQWGRLLSVIVMIVGVSLFLNLVRAVLRPTGVYVKCTGCGLIRHDRDAIHCKHCGTLLRHDHQGI